MTVSLCLLALASASACNPTPLEKAAGTVAKEQGVERAVVLDALKSFRNTEDEQIQLAKAWQRELPATKLPNMVRTADRFSDLTAAARDELVAAGCAAVLDAIRDEEVPNAAKFAEDYLTGAAIGRLPQHEVLEIAEAFEELYDQAVAGDYSALKIRLTLMKFKYCNSF